MAQVIELEDIYTALSSSKPTLYKAIVSLIFSSSMSTSTISRLTLYDFLYACDEYFEAEEEKIFDNLLKKNANASGFFIFGALTAIVPSLAKVDFSMLGQLGITVVAVFAVTVAGIILAFKILPLWKIVGDKDLCIGIAMCQMIGYPGTQLISEEISKAVGKTPEEIDYLEKRIGTAYVISGFTSVTVLSIVVATIMAKIL